jgi:hypothetical protein
VRRIFAFMRILFLAMLAIGCGESSAYLEDESHSHQQQAAALAQAQQFQHASEEQKRATELHEQAVKQALKEGRANDLAFVHP